MTVYKPGKEEFKTVVLNYVSQAASHAETFALVDYWTNYYQSKFWMAVQEARANA